MALVVQLAGRAWAGDAALAEQLFQEGKALLDQGKNEEACAKLRASMEAEPSGGAALAYARCSQLLGKTATAWAELRRAAALFRAQGDTSREQFARQQADALEPGLSTLTIVPSGAKGVTVRRDGLLVAAGALGTKVPVDPGNHTVEVEAPGHEPWRGTVMVGPERDAKVLRIPQLRKRPGASAEPPGHQSLAPQSGQRLVIVGGVVIGVGALALVGGGILGGTVMSDAAAAEEDPALCGNAGNVCSADGYELVEGARDRALAANILFGVGIAGAVGGAALLAIGLTRGSGAARDAARASNSSVLRGHPGGVALRLPF